jgi:NAD(P)-dependent dehydrogenase (short-subunit alcohol dehydrogenase family)
MGRSIALNFAKIGVNVVIADIDVESAEKVSAEVRELGVGSISVRTDVSSFEDVEGLADVAYREFDDIAVLVNNAGVNWRPFRASWDATAEDYEWLMNINFWGVLNGHRAFVPRMRSRDLPKHIVNTSSVAALMPALGHAGYAASKAAVDGLSIAARAEFEIAGFDIDVSILYPARVATSIGTSERLRPAEHQPAQRQIIPWTDYAGPAAVASNEGIVADQRLVTAPHQAIDPAWVGPMVVDAILQNRPYILTHPMDTAIEERATELLRSYVPILDPLP